MKEFGGQLLTLNRGDINTDEIIPARYLTEITKQALAPYLLEDLKLDGFDPAKDIAGKAAVLTGENFGCGSSREHAPWAFEVNGINVVVASGFARIFRQNMFNCGMLAIELDAALIAELIADFGGPDASLAVDLDRKILTFSAAGAGAAGKTREVPFELSGYDEALVRAGGWVDYADSNY
ncbi:MAG: 3-isopropylmalate dehydratase small subunit [Spirochaetaceae bacterium]|nr:MAG: 3-isopropylmalate dehydratase small subunit [Spirochaetaceae bacterium]